MKNIHLLPTDKPSRLFKDDFGKLLYSINIDQEQKHFQPLNLYITSLEEIKEGDWVCHKSITNDEYQIIKCNISNKTSIQEHWRKIILTTDQDLINDGVQTIYDEFLQWFVKNPKCEEVEMTYENDTNLFGYDFCYYKIIIPKEEPKLTNNCPKCGLDLIEREGSKPVCKRIDCSGIVLSDETLKEWSSKEHLKQTDEKGKLLTFWQGVDFSNKYADKHSSSSTTSIPKEELKQETALEAGEKWVFETNGHKWSNNNDETGDNLLSFLKGVEWQQEQYNTSKVTRIEVIQHSEPYNGRAYTNYKAKDVEIQIQDNGKTLKIFLK